MAEDQIRYDVLVQDALRGVVRKVLSEIAQTGLPGEHHFYITFYTGAPGVRLSSRLRERYPEEMTIVIQHQYWDLSVNDQGFEVGLSFSGIPEKLLVPFAAIKSIFDPSVKFGLEFQLAEEEKTSVKNEEKTPVDTSSVKALTHDGGGALTADSIASKDAAEMDENKPAPQSLGESKTASVVSLDSFRKKP